MNQFQKIGLLLISNFMLAGSIHAQVTDPAITSWVMNSGTQTGYSGILSNVLTVSYTTTDVYVTANCIPGYDIGPWAGNPNTPANRNFLFKITRTPVRNTGTLTNVGLGHVGIWKNGVSIFNALDGMTYNNGGVWHRDAYKFEGASFDNCLGHPAPNGEYHHHIAPICLYNINDSTNHSPIIGFAFDGFPIYGNYGYSDAASATSAIKRMSPSYRYHNYADRSVATTGLTAAGPAINATYPLGSFKEDYEFVSGLGDLDANNGRFCVTPEYPNGTYAYFVTNTASGVPLFPYTLGSTYYGVVQTGNTGPAGGHNTVPAGATVYNPVTSLADNFETQSIKAFPQPVNHEVTFKIEGLIDQTTATLTIYDALGREVIKETPTMLANEGYTLDLSMLNSGTYRAKIVLPTGVKTLTLTKN
jgi:hypothetical protein